MNDARPGVDEAPLASEESLPPGTAALLKRWLEAVSVAEPASPSEADAAFPEREARDVLEALLDHMRGAVPGKLESAGRAWGRAHRSVGGVVEHLSRLREIFLTSSLGNLLEIHRALDRITAVATVEVTARIERVSRTDALTGVGNRRAFDETIQATLSAASRQGHEVTVVAVDLDGLKKINDSQGHAAGDATLVSLVGALNDELRDEDTIFRLGGDEFVMVLPFTSVDVAGALMRRVADAGAPSFAWGAAGYPQDGTEPKDVVDAADRDMYRNRGINRAPAKNARKVASAERWNPARSRRLVWIPAAAVVAASVAIALFSTTSSPRTSAKKPPTGTARARTAVPGTSGSPTGGLAAAPGSSTGSVPPQGVSGSLPNAATASFTEPLASTQAAPGTSARGVGAGAIPSSGGSVSASPGGNTTGGSGGASASSGGSSTGQAPGPSRSGGVVGTVSQLLSPVPVVGGSGGLVSVVDQLLTGSAAAPASNAATQSTVASVVTGSLGIG